MSLPDTARILMTAAGVMLALAGLGALVIAHRSRASEDPAPRLPLLGPVSIVSAGVVGLACLGVGYHLFVHAAEFTNFRAPLPLALGVGVAAVLGSLGVDGLERRKGPPGGG